MTYNPQYPTRDVGNIQEEIMFGRNFVRAFGLIAIAFVVALLLAAFVIPSVTYAAPPLQTAPAPADLATVVGGFLDLLIALAVGGGVAYVLQMSGAWKAWESPLKPVVVLVLTAILGGTLAALKVLATAELFAQAPEFARAFLSFVVVFFGSQLTYQKGFSFPQSKFPQ